MTARTAELSETNEQLQEEIARRERVQRELIHIARHDQLTGMASRMLFEETLAQRRRCRE